MKVLITGAGGKLAGDVAADFAPDYDVVYTARGPVDGLPEGVLYPIDLADTTSQLDDDLEAMMASEAPDVIIHLGSMLGGICNEKPEEAEQVNVTATQKLAALAVKHGVRSFVFASTAAVYPSVGMHAVTEAEVAETPASVYGQTKLRAEHALAETAVDGKTVFTAARIFNIYGSRFTDSVVNKLVHSTLENPVGLVGPETFVRDYVHSSDVVKAFREIIAADQSKTTGSFAAYNIASGVPTSNGELIKQLEAKGLELHYTMKDIPLNVSWANIDAARSAFGFDPQTTIIVD